MLYLTCFMSDLSKMPEQSVTRLHWALPVQKLKSLDISKKKKEGNVLKQLL